ncbi:MAG: SCO family protein [Cypionkella sp.]|nr:SCO family protein [Cypionkella sp.]
MKRDKLYLGAAASAVAALIGGSMLYVAGPNEADAFAQCRAGAVGGGAIGGPFTLTDENGKTVTEKDVITGPTLVYFGYTFCPDVCPLDSARNAEAVDILDGKGKTVTPVLISFDPERDTPEVLRDFTDAMHPRMLGLTGTPEQIKAASAAYKTYFKRQEDGDPEYYLMDHSTFTYLMMPEIGFVDYFDRNITAADMAARLECFIDQAASE